MEPKTFPAGGLPGALEQVNEMVSEGADLLAAVGERPYALSSALLASLGRYRAALDLGGPREIAHAEVEAKRALRTAVDRLVAATKAAESRGPR